MEKIIVEYPEVKLVGIVTLTIPAQTYVKFTNGPGAMPSILMDV